MTLSPRVGYLAAGAAVGAVASVAYGGGFPNTDAQWTLVWGRELLHLQGPRLDVGGTPHPLTVLLGVFAAALQPASETVLQVVGYAAVGALIVGAFVAGSRLFGLAAGILAAVLVATRDTLLFYGALAYVDVIFAALIMWAVALEAARPRRGLPVLVLLVIAGLARPEAWLLSAAYWLYARPPDKRAALAWAGLCLAAPLLWMAMDLVLTGDPLWSYTSTHDDAAHTGRPTGPGGLISSGPEILARAVRPEVGLVAMAGLAMTLRSRRFGLLAATIAVTTLAVAVPVLAGDPLNDRYVLAIAALLCVAAAAPLPALLRRGEATGWRVAAAVCMLVLVAGAVDQLPRLEERRADLVDRTERRDAARATLEPAVPCLPVVVPNKRLMPAVATRLDVDLEQVRDGRHGIPRGSYLWGTRAAMRNLVVIEGRPLAAAKAPSAPVVRRHEGWRLMARCPG